MVLSKWHLLILSGKEQTSTQKTWTSPLVPHFFSRKRKTFFTVCLVNRDPEESQGCLWKACIPRMWIALLLLFYDDDNNEDHDSNYCYFDKGRVKPTSACAPSVSYASVLRLFFESWPDRFLLWELGCARGKAGLTKWARPFDSSRDWALVLPTLSLARTEICDWLPFLLSVVSAWAAGWIDVFPELLDQGPWGRGFIWQLLAEYSARVP